MMDSILPFEDREITAILQKSLKKRGIKLYTSTKAVSMDKMDNNRVSRYFGGFKR